MTDKPNTFVGLDLGGPQTRCLVAVGAGSALRYLGCGAMPPVRWDDGEEREPQMTSEAVLEAIYEAEQGAGLTIVAAVVGIGAAQVRSRLVHSTVSLPRGQGTVQVSDIGNAVRKCSKGVLGAESTVLQLVPLQFVAGSGGGVLNPLGMPADQLEAFVRLISTSREEHDAARRLANRASLRVAETVLGGFAAAYSTLTDRECAQGVAHLDIGKRASSLTAYCGGALRVASGIPVGRDHLVKDVSRAFGTDPAVGSSLITDFGSVDPRAETMASYVLVPGLNVSQPEGLGRPWPRRMLDKLLALRLEECMQLVRDELRHEGLLRGGVRSFVITGDVALMPGIKDLAQAVVGLRTRVGVPGRPEDLPEPLKSPSWACAAGLVLYAHRLSRGPAEESAQPESFARRRRQEKAT